MSTQKSRGLGRGFDALLPMGVSDPEFDVTASLGGNGTSELPLASIVPNPHQPRQTFDESTLAQLADSIGVHGVLQPVVVTKLGEGRYELIAGERRLRAAKIAGLSTIPALVRSFDEQTKLELALIENLQREDLNPLEVATAYRKLFDQFSMTLDQIAARVGKDKSTVSNVMRLLGLPTEAKRALVACEITEGHARTILMVSDPIKQALLLHTIRTKFLSVRQAEEFARGLREEVGGMEKAHKRIENSNEVTKSLSEYLGTRVTMRTTAKGGQLTIDYYSDEELERIYAAIRPTQE